MIQFHLSLIILFAWSADDMILGTDRILVNNIQSQFSMFFFLNMMISMKISEIYLKISDKDIAFFSSIQIKIKIYLIVRQSIWNTCKILSYILISDIFR